MANSFYRTELKVFLGQFGKVDMPNEAWDALADMVENLREKSEKTNSVVQEFVGKHTAEDAPAMEKDDIFSLGHAVYDIVWMQNSSKTKPNLSPRWEQEAPSFRAERNATRQDPFES